MPEGMKAVDSALDRVASRMTPIIRNRALEAGWPEDVVSKISMIRSANGLDVHVDEEAREQVEDLEYGSMTSAPRSVLSTLYSAQTKKQIVDISEDSMDELIERVQRVFS